MPEDETITPAFEFAGAAIIDHTPTDADKTGANAFIVQYSTSDPVIDNGKTCLYRAVAKYVER